MPTLTTTRPSACCIPTCTTCLPHRIAHWQCAACGSGPYRFDKSDAGPYRVLRPHFERTKQRYITREDGSGKWEYTVRRICSPVCWQSEIRAIHGDEMALAQQSERLAPAIEAKVEQETQALLPPPPQDDLDLPANTHPGQF